MSLHDDKAKSGTSKSAEKGEVVDKSKIRQNGDEAKVKAKTKASVAKRTKLIDTKFVSQNRLKEQSSKIFF